MSDVYQYIACSCDLDLRNTLPLTTLLFPVTDEGRSNAADAAVAADADGDSRRGYIEENSKPEMHALHNPVL